MINFGNLKKINDKYQMIYKTEIYAHLLFEVKEIFESLVLKFWFTYMILDKK